MFQVEELIRLMNVSPLRKALRWLPIFGKIRQRNRRNSRLNGGLWNQSCESDPEMQTPFIHGLHCSVWSTHLSQSLLEQKEQSSASRRNSAETDEITLKTLRVSPKSAAQIMMGWQHWNTLSTGQHYEQSFRQNGGAQTRHPIPCNVLGVWPRLMPVTMSTSRSLRCWHSSFAKCCAALHQPWYHSYDRLPPHIHKSKFTTDHRRSPWTSSWPAIA